MGFWASLPLADVAWSLKATDHALDTLPMELLYIKNIGGRYVGDPDFDPVFAELDINRSSSTL